MEPVSMGFVQLRLAFEWTCPECGIDKFERVIAWEGAPEEKKELQDFLEIAGVPEEQAKQGFWCRHPDVVTCENCGQAYSTEHPE